MNTNNNLNGNGHKPQFRPASLRNRFPWLRRNPQPKAPGVSNGNYRAQDRVGYDTDGVYSHGKPVGGETQFGIEGKVPAPAFGMPDAKVEEYKKAARAAAYLGGSLEDVRAQGGRMFDGRYAVLKAQFQGRIAAARRLIDPMEFKASVIAHEAGALSAVIKDKKDELSIPHDWRLLAMVVLVVLWGFVTYSEWINAAARQLYLVQDWGKAKAATAPWLAVGVVLEFIIISTVGATGLFWRRVWRVVSLTSIVAYAILYALRFGASAETTAASTIASAMAGAGGEANGGSGIWLDQAVFFGQLFFGLVCGATLLEAALNLMVPHDSTISNPERERLEAGQLVLVERINHESSPLAKALGHLAEWEACRDGFIDIGVRSYQAAQGETQIFDLEYQIIMRERDLLERKRRALLS